MFKDLAKERFSCRKFKSIEVEEEKLNDILETGNLAPTAKNVQPHRIYVLKSKQALETLDKLSPCRYGAKTVLLFTYNTDEDWKNPLEDGVRSGVEDVSIVATHIMLEAKELGLDTCWCNYFNNTELERAFNIPENERSVLFMPIGYRDENAVISPMHSSKKELTKIVKYL